MTCVLRNNGPASLAHARFTTVLPAQTSLVPGSLSPWATYDPATRQIEWQGALDRNAQMQIAFRIRVNDPLPDGTSIHFPARIGYQEHMLSFEAPYILRVNAPELKASTLEVEPGIAPPTSTLAYVLTVRNTGLRDALATVTATAPSRTHFTGTLDIQGIGRGEVFSTSLSWSGLIPAGRQTRLRYQLTSGDKENYWLAHQAHVRDQFNEHWPIEAYAYIRLAKLYLPIVYGSSRPK
jgi:hypothetical protein